RTLTIFKIFERIFQEHFTVVEDKIEVKSPKKLHSGCIQSPDDLNATYREKNGKKSKGQTINVVETANPDNPVNLLNDVSVSPNNQDDSKILNKRIDKLKKKTPDLNELHTDGAYGSSDNDKKCEELKIRMVQSGVRGDEAAVPFEIKEISEDRYKVSCPYQTVDSQKSRKRFKAEFDLSVCKECKMSQVCPTQIRKNCRTFYFIREDYLRKKRIKNRDALPPERRKLRSNVEATINEFVRKMPKGKLKVRGVFKTAVFVYLMAMSINFGRIYRYNQKKSAILAAAVKCFDFFKEQLFKINNYDRILNFNHAYKTKYA
ncbi:MAG: transposase, partial [Bacteroidota bacterium]|nr:transposase [Bacteroidota bacterium]